MEKNDDKIQVKIYLNKSNKLFLKYLSMEQNKSMSTLIDELLKNYKMYYLKQL